MAMHSSPTSILSLSASNTPPLDLLPATPQQYDQSIARHASQWAKSLPDSLYFERERLLNTRPATAHGNLTCWVLVPRTTPKTLEFFCSCETIERSVIIFPPHSRSREVRPAYSICSVYCPSQHRHKGYATTMMHLLHQKLAHPHWLAKHYPDLLPGTHNKAVVSMLYSDIGPEFYARIKPPGWHPYPSLETTWLVPEPSAPLPSLDPSVASPVVPIYEDEFREIAAGDRRRLWEEDVHECAFAVAPTGDEMDWLASRSMFYARLEALSPDGGHHPWGCRPKRGDDRACGGAFVLWTVDYPARTIWLLRVRASDSDGFFESALRLASQLARERGCRTIKAWNVDQRLVERSAGLTVHRQDSLSAAAVYLVSENECGDEQVHQTLDWVADEKLFWC